MHSLKEYLKAYEKRFIYSVLLTYEWDKHRTAKALGIGLSTLYRKIKEFNIRRS